MQCRKLGVDIRLGVDADVRAVLAESPDLVFVATGAAARAPGLEGMEEHTVVSAWDVLRGSAGPLGKVVLVM